MPEIMRLYPGIRAYARDHVPMSEIRAAISRWFDLPRVIQSGKRTSAVRTFPKCSRICRVRTSGVGRAVFK